MNLDKLKIGDFITMWDSENISVARITGFDRYKFDKPDKLNGKVCGVFALVFPYWKEFSSASYNNFARISPYYAEQSDYSSEAEVTAWLKCAAEHEAELRAEADDVHKWLTRTVVSKRIRPMSEIYKHEYPRLPPTGCINWLWCTLKRFKFWNPKKGIIKPWLTAV